MMREKKTTKDIDSYRTKDGSLIREIFHPTNSGVCRQSLAEARLLPGEETEKHFHRNSEEIYYVLQGKGRVRIGQELTEISAGEGLLLPPGTAHSIKNIGNEELIFLCMSSPPYNHDDTELVL
jgi:mannose-6-phosphate isomerase-like protein (cupin superfamily)